MIVMKERNWVAKHLRTFNVPKVETNRKRELKKGKGKDQNKWAQEAHL